MNQRRYHGGRLRPCCDKKLQIRADCSCQVWLVGWLGQRRLEHHRHPANGDDKSYRDESHDDSCSSDLSDLGAAIRGSFENQIWRSQHGSA